MHEDDGGPWLFTPGPINTAKRTREAMLRDLGSRDGEFIAITGRVRARLLAISGAGAGFVCVPIQGSGTFAVEAAVGTLVPPGGKALVLVNGVYGRRIAKMCEIAGRNFTVFETAETVAPTGAEVAAVLAGDPGITHVAAVHCETTSGILNPIEEIAAAVARAGRRLLIDAMSTFGILPLGSDRMAYDALIASSNKCLEGVPGMGFVIARTGALASADGNAHSLALDLHDQWRFLEKTGQWRFTPPTHVMAALDAALTAYEAEGGRDARLGRYKRNCQTLVAGMRALGFQTLIPDHLQAPVIVTFACPADPKFKFEAFYEALRRRGFVIYPGKLTKAETFRVGCIGAIGSEQIEGLIAAVGEVLAEQGLSLAS
ncbi:MAG TPA: 2-aminoethylphosphonate--pyruvate transaminase [Alphaproteobacteria bacterium]|nr:2-aminoethylphosphonate--pyruvate transaminase [Alphaproteobacteria bacterium]